MSKSTYEPGYLGPLLKLKVRLDGKITDFGLCIALSNTSVADFA